MPSSSSTFQPGISALPSKSLLPGTTQTVSQFKVAAIKKRLDLQDIETKQNDLNEKIVVNNNFEI